MTETRFTWRWILVVGLIGAVVGIVLGLGAGWMFPISSPQSGGLSALKPEEQNQYIILVANSYAYDQDLQLARDRLAELKDPNIKARVERLAKSLTSKQDPDAAAVADLAVALGSNDSSLRVMAGSVVKQTANQGEPTKLAKVSAPPTETPRPTDVPSPTIQATDTLAPTATSKVVATKIAPAAPKATAKPAATNPPPPPPAPVAANPAPGPEFQPAFPGMWYSSSYIPANVAPGQQYWRLRYARYCDWAPDEAHNPCPNMPGGIMDHTIYIMVLDANGACASNPTIRVDINTGDVMRLGANEAKSIPYPWFSSSCLFDWEKAMWAEGNDVSVEGLPSDKITNLKLASKSQPPGYEGKEPPEGHAHVHYFLVFQLATR